MRIYKHEEETQTEYTLRTILAEAWDKGHVAASQGQSEDANPHVKEDER